MSVHPERDIEPDVVVPPTPEKAAPDEPVPAIAEAATEPEGGAGPEEPRLEPELAPEPDDEAGPAGRPQPEAASDTARSPDARPEPQPVAPSRRSARPKPKARPQRAKPKPKAKAKPKAAAKPKRGAAAKRAPKRSAAAADNVIATFGLTKRFGGLVAVDNLDLEVRRGEVFGYLGPNGSGKSTTIRMLLDFVRPSAGSFELLGSQGAVPDVRRRIGYLPAELRFEPRYTAEDVIAFSGRLRGGYDDGFVKQLVARFDLDAGRPIGQLSTGNRRKVGIVQAFMHRPELYLLDEPTQGLDPLLQYEFHQLIADVKRDGATVFLSSHVLPEVEVLADRVGILRKGILVTVAAVDELQRQARQRIELYVSGSASVRSFAKLPGVIEASRAGNIISVVVEGSVDAVIKEASKLNVRRIVTRETDLEDVFLRYYKDGA